MIKKSQVTYHVQDGRVNFKLEKNKFHCSKAHFVALQSCLSGRGVSLYPTKSQWVLLSANRIAEWESV